MNKRITLIGAYGFTGKLIAEKLNEFGIPFGIAGKNEQKLQTLKQQFPTINEVIAADILDEKDIENLLEKSDILINCVGPFNLYAGKLVGRVAEKKIIYIDITGEQEIVRHSFEELSNISVQNKSLIIHSVSFESCLTMLLAKEICDPAEKYRSINSYYHFEKSRPSPGTKFTMNLSKHFPTYDFENNLLEKRKPLSRSFPFQNGLAAFMPYPEIIFISAKYKTGDCGSYIKMAESEAAFLSAGASHEISIEKTIQKHQSSKHHLPDEAERKKQYFTLELIAEKENGSSVQIGLKGFDMYGITAVLAVSLINKLLEAENLPCGVTDPSTLLSLDEIINDEELNIQLI